MGDMLEMKKNCKYIRYYQNNKNLFKIINYLTKN